MVKPSLEYGAVCLGRIICANVADIALSNVILGRSNNNVRLAVPVNISPRGDAVAETSASLSRFQAGTGGQSQARGAPCVKEDVPLFPSFGGSETDKQIGERILIPVSCRAERKAKLACRAMPLDGLLACGAAIGLDQFGRRIGEVRRNSQRGSVDKLICRCCGRCFSKQACCRADDTASAPSTMPKSSPAQICRCCLT